MSDSSDSTITVCVGNYGYYNEGELHDAWINLPVVDDAALMSFLKEHDLYDAAHEEIYISDYDGVPFNASDLFGEYNSLYELNLLAKLMQTDTQETEAVKMALDCGIDSPDSILGLMNWIVQADEIPFFAYDFEGIEYVDEWGQTAYERMNPYTLMGYTALEDNPALRVALEQDSSAMGAFDVERYGESKSMEYGLELGGTGYIDTHIDMPSQDYYDKTELTEMIEEKWNQRLGASKPKQSSQPRSVMERKFDLMNKNQNKGSVSTHRRSIQ